MITADECRAIRKANLDALYEKRQEEFKKAFRYVEERFCDFVHQSTENEYMIGYNIRTRPDIIVEITNIVNDFQTWNMFLSYCKTQFENCGYQCEIEKIAGRFLRITWEENEK